jgi:Na+-driven multidrug efflux pump
MAFTQAIILLVFNRHLYELFTDIEEVLNIIEETKYLLPVQVFFDCIMLVTSGIIRGMGV